MTDPRKVLDEAVEAGARAIYPDWFVVGASILNNCPGQMERCQERGRQLARAAILAALPVIGEAMVGVADEMPTMRAISPSHVHANTPADVAAAQRAFIERMMG